MVLEALRGSCGTKDAIEDVPTGPFLTNEILPESSGEDRTRLPEKGLSGKR